MEWSKIKKNSFKISTTDFQKMIRHLGNKNNSINLLLSDYSIFLGDFNQDTPYKIGETDKKGSSESRIEEDGMLQNSWTLGRTKCNKYSKSQTGFYDKQSLAMM